MNFLYCEYFHLLVPNENKSKPQLNFLNAPCANLYHYPLIMVINQFYLYNRQNNVKKTKKLKHGILKTSA